MGGRIAVTVAQRQVFNRAAELRLIMIQLMDKLQTCSANKRELFNKRYNKAMREYKSLQKKAKDIFFDWQIKQYLNNDSCTKAQYPLFEAECM